MNTNNKKHRSIEQSQPENSISTSATPSVSVSIFSDSSDSSPTVSTSAKFKSILEKTDGKKKRTSRVISTKSKGQPKSKVLKPKQTTKQSANKLELETDDVSGIFSDYSSQADTDTTLSQLFSVVDETKSVPASGSNNRDKQKPMSKNIQTRKSKSSLIGTGKKVHPENLVENTSSSNLSYRSRSSAHIQKLASKVGFKNFPLKNLDPEESGFGPGEDAGGLRRSGHRGKLGSTVLRVRGGRKTMFKFTSIGEDNEIFDPLDVDNIKNAEDYDQWRRNAHLTLPSFVGVPVENSGDVVHVGMNAIQENRRRSLDPKSAYNSLYDEVQRHHSSAEPDISVLPLIPQPPPEKEEDTASINDKIEALQMLAEHLTEKRRHKREIILQQKQPHIRKKAKMTMSDLFGNVVIYMHRQIHDFISMITIWKNGVYEIHGTYGIGAASYFEWLRRMLIFNVLYLILVVFFVVIPELKLDSSISSISKSCSPTKRCGLRSNGLSIPFSIFDLFTGQGSLEKSYLYYSGYKDTNADPFCPSKTKTTKHTDSVFQITAFRFAFMCFLIFFLNSIYVLTKAKSHFHVAKLVSKVPGLKDKVLYKSVLCAWDFNCSGAKAAKLQHTSIWRELRLRMDSMDEAKSKTFVQATKRVLLSKLIKKRGEKSATRVVHIIANLCVLITYAIALGILYFLFQIREFWLESQTLVKCHDSIPGYLLTLPAIYMAISFFLISQICTIISEFEDWESVEIRNFVFTARVGFYYVLNIVAVYGYWLLKAKKLIEEQLCYEEYFGQELYRILLFQGIFNVGGSLLFSGTYHWYKKRKNPNYIKPKFDPTNRTLNLFFLHALSGLGFVFCPLISVLVIIRLIFSYYYNKYRLINFCRFPTRAARVSDIELPNLVAYIVSYVITSILNIILLFELHPSKMCGPFSHYPSHYYDVLKEGLVDTKFSFLHLILNPAVTIILICCILGIMHIVRAVARGNFMAMEKLHHLLLLERKDRNFILEAIYRVGKKSCEIEGDYKGHKLVPHQQLKVKEKSNAWMESNLVTGIFNSHRRSMALPMEFVKTADEPRTSHGTIGNYNWDWLPSDWNRKGRRSATTITDTDRQKLQTFKNNTKSKVK